MSQFNWHGLCGNISFQYSFQYKRLDSFENTPVFILTMFSQGRIDILQETVRYWANRNHPVILCSGKNHNSDNRTQFLENNTDIFYLYWELTDVRYWELTDVSLDGTLYKDGIYNVGTARNSVLQFIYNLGIRRFILSDEKINGLLIPIDRKLYIDGYLFFKELIQKHNNVAPGGRSGGGGGGGTSKKRSAPSSGEKEERRQKSLRTEAPVWARGAKPSTASSSSNRQVYKKVNTGYKLSDGNKLNRTDIEKSKQTVNFKELDSNTAILSVGRTLHLQEKLTLYKKKEIKMEGFFYIDVDKLNETMFFFPTPWSEDVGCQFFYENKLSSQCLGCIVTNLVNAPHSWGGLQYGFNENMFYHMWKICKNIRVCRQTIRDEPTIRLMWSTQMGMDLLNLKPQRPQYWSNPYISSTIMLIKLCFTTNLLERLPDVGNTLFQSLFGLLRPDFVNLIHLNFNEYEIHYLLKYCREHWSKYCNFDTCRLFDTDYLKLVEEPYNGWGPNKKKIRKMSKT